LPDESIDVIVTSPPYWGQRTSLGHGVEDDPREYVESLVAVFATLLPKLEQASFAYWFDERLGYQRLNIERFAAGFDSEAARKAGRLGAVASQKVQTLDKMRENGRKAAAVTNASLTKSQRSGNGRKGQAAMCRTVGAERLREWGKAVQGTLTPEQIKTASVKGSHVRWHVRRGFKNPGCILCRSNST
jgi:hypothetical protein